VVGVADTSTVLLVLQAVLAVAVMVAVQVVQVIHQAQAHHKVTTVHH
jgi:hypothetical protein